MHKFQPSSALVKLSIVQGAMMQSHQHAGRSVSMYSCILHHILLMCIYRHPCCTLNPKL